MRASTIRSRPPLPRWGARGFTLIELMVAMLLGLIVIAGVSSVFLANMRSYRSNTALSDVQSNARIAFEFMARDIRQAGFTGCNSAGAPIVTVLNNAPGGTATEDWWADWGNAVRGFDASQTDPAAPARTAGTDSLMLIGASGTSSVIASSELAAATFVLNDTNADIQTGSPIIVCNPARAAIAQASQYVSATGTVTLAASGTPGNATTDLGFESNDDCGAAGGAALPDGCLKNASVALLNASDWYVGTVDDVTSLYRASLTTDAAGATKAEAQEIIRNVTGMDVTYHVAGSDDFKDATAVAAGDWVNVDAVRVKLTLRSTDARAGTDQKALTRTFTTTTTIRNRVE